MESRAGRLSPVPERVSGRSRSRSPPKQRFPDKFHAMLQAAQDAHVKAAHQRDLQDRRSLSVSMLVEGRADAFVDFFMLSQPPAQPSAQDTASSSGASTSASSNAPELAWQSMVLLQEQLVRADAADREHDPQAVFDAHRTMARHFTQLGMLQNAVFFWKKCLQVAVSASSGPQQLETNCALGLLYESQGQPALAMAHHERCLQLSQELQRPDDEATAYAQLVQVHAQQAEQLARQGDTKAAAASYTKCRDAALGCGDLTAAGTAAHHLGLIAQQAGDWQQALEHQRTFLEISRQAGDQEMQGRAGVACADCQHKLGRLDGALESLETFLQLSHSQAPRGQATACCKLGVLYHQQGKLDQAVSYFERFYELARSLGERRLLDLARVNLGAARAELKLKRYKAMAWSDIDGVLKWKCSRQPF